MNNTHHTRPDPNGNDAITENFLAQLRAEAGDIEGFQSAINILESDPRLREELPLLLQAHAHESDGQAYWGVLQAMANNPNGRADLTSLLGVVTSCLPEESATRKQMASTLARVEHILMSDDATAVSEQHLDNDTTWQQLGRKHAAQEILADQKMHAFLTAVAAKGENAVKTMAENESARNLLCGILMMDSWDVSVATKRLQEVLSDID